MGYCAHKLTKLIALAPPQVWDASPAHGVLHSVLSGYNVLEDFKSAPGHCKVQEGQGSDNSSVQGLQHSHHVLLLLLCSEHALKY